MDSLQTLSFKANLFAAWQFLCRQSLSTCSGQQARLKQPAAAEQLWGQEESLEKSLKEEGEGKRAEDKRKNKGWPVFEVHQIVK